MHTPSADPASGDRLQSLGAFVRAQRTSLSLTQKQLAERLGWTQERISVLERGRYGMPSLQALELLATSLEVSLATVIEAAGYTMEQTQMMRQAADQRDAGALLLTLHELLGVQAMSLREALTEAATILADLMAVDKIDAFILEPESQTLVALGASTTPMGFRQRELGLDRVPLAHGTREVQVFESGEPYLTEDTAQDPGILPGVRDSLGVQSMIVVPLDVGGERQGVVTANSSRPGSFTAGDLAFLQTVARWVGIVAQRAEMAEAVTQEAVRTARHATAEELMQVLAHDLTNLVTPALGRLDLIRRQAERDGHETYVTHARAAAVSVRRIERLVRDLLDSSRLEYGLFVLVAQPLDLPRLVQEAAQLFATDEVLIQVRGVEELMVEGEPDRLRQVLENLVSNAVEHSPAGVPVVVEIGLETRGDGPWASVRVIDQGPGIPAELLPTLFQRFARGSGSSGLGIGLYLARGIAEAHGGTLDIDPTERGTTMRLALPVTSK